MCLRLATSCLFVVLAGACATPKPEGPPLQEWERLFPQIVDPTRPTDGPRGFYRAKAPTGEQGKQLDKAVQVYIDGDDEEFARLTEEHTKHPVLAFWHARFLWKFVWEARVAAARRTDQAPPIGDPVWVRPIRHLKSMGQAAVPTIVIDLVRSRYADQVELGRELLEELGPEAYPAWSGIFEVEDARARRRTLEILAKWEDLTPGMLALLQKGASDAEFGVRSVAYRGLAQHDGMLPVVLRALEEDGDPFVERAIAEALGERSERSRPVAEALLRYMERTVESGDHRGTVAADDALRKMSGLRKRGNLRTWRSWVSTMRETGS